MVVLAVLTGLRCCDVVALRLEEIDRRRDGIQLVEAKTSNPLVLPLAAQLPGHASIDSSRSCFSQAGAQIRQCCLSLGSSPEPGRGCDEHDHLQSRAPHRDDARMAG